MSDFSIFIAGLTEKLAGPLPGLSSQLKMASMSRITKDGNMVIPVDVRKAGVLVLFYPCGQEICIAFIRRAEYPGVHSGQISFPGGSRENHDKDITETALREMEEEIGVDRHLVTTIGKLSDLFIPPSNFLVTPVVGYTQIRPDFIPDTEEVESVLEISLDELLRTESMQEKEISIFPAMNIKVPCYYVNGNVIWGATAMMLIELIDIISPGS